MKTTIITIITLAFTFMNSYAHEKLFSKAMRKTSEENFKDNIDLSYKR